jgi:hypothetical protein
VPGGAFATFPITDGTFLLGLTMRVGGQSVEQRIAVLQAATAGAAHRF